MISKDKIVKVLLEALRVFVYGGLTALASHFGWVAF
jgi:hypothetical protein